MKFLIVEFIVAIVLLLLLLHFPSWFMVLVPATVVLGLAHLMNKSKYVQ